MAAAHSTASTSESTRRVPPAEIVLLSVEAGDELICRTLDPEDAERQRVAWNTVTRGIMPEARIITEVYSVLDVGTAPKFSVLGPDGILLRSPSMAAVSAFVDGWVSAGGNRDEVTILPRWLDRQTRNAARA